MIGFLGFFIFFSFSVLGNTEIFLSDTNNKVTISGKIEGQNSVKIDLAYHLFDKTYVSDSAKTDASGNFRFSGKYEPGSYILYLSHIKQQIPILINNESEIVLTSKLVDGVMQTSIIKSKENSIYYSILDFNFEKNKKFEQIKEYYKDKTSPEEQAEFTKLTATFREEVDAFVRKSNAENPQLFVSKYMLAQRNPVQYVCPKGLSPEICLIQEKDHYRLHFFDNLDLSDERLIRTEILANKVNYFFDEFLTQRPEIIIPELDALLQRKDLHPEIFKTILISYLNKYASSPYIGFDAIYVHLVDNYYTNGKAAWVEPELKQKLKTAANRLRPNLIGKKMENLSFTDLQTNLPLELYSIKSEKILLHCHQNPAKDLAELKTFALNNTSFKTLVVFHEDNADKVRQYREALSENGRLLPNIYVVAISESDFKQLQTKLDFEAGRNFILDQNFTILFKQFSVGQLPEILTRIGG